MMKIKNFLESKRQKIIDKMCENTSVTDDKLFLFIFQYMKIV